MGMGPVGFQVIGTCTRQVLAVALVSTSAGAAPPLQNVTGRAWAQKCLQSLWVRGTRSGLAPRERYSSRQDAGQGGR